ncbi:plasma membrane calcium [Elasticomyces elasticus]|uniref:Calcium-transporting ATPase n=1 Tax=Exophiala sideris TaxID=1016849 RepID=A0ABR0J536_9EURO|nr:plasma membrane calcium [Elasticomyces elasticus]KAK5026529.1 plasma membrane calcium [Exophiala sideris]KAK5033731.1 plasma membrane calcium [Exophiala sideris]KAK5055554.1 plasma membrane calcium [Exophiala sideris]KAK5180064.1 plasma membrane calcium [Eurotiomycetes sp. CCFEE 6388]
MATQKASAPKITLDTSSLAGQETISPTSQPLSHGAESSMSTPPQSHIDESSYLSPTTPVQGVSYDGSTLNSRSGSVQSGQASNRDRSDSAISATSTVTFHSKSSLEYEKPDDVLRPDRGNEKDFEVPNNPFAYSPGQLNKLLNPKSLSAYKALGGIQGLERGLRTNLKAGLSVDETRLDGKISFEEAAAVNDGKTLSELPRNSPESMAGSPDRPGQFQDRLKVYGDNRLPERKPDGILLLIWRAYNDKILILLTLAAVISLALGIYETVSGGLGVDWIEGVAICVAILIVVIVGAANDWQKERQFVRLNKRKDDREVKVIRSGKSVQVSVYDITVGDVLHLEPGDAVPADGVFTSGHGIKCDESSATGESDQMKKTPGQEVWQRIQDGTATAKLDPFIISGAKVLEGVGTYLVTSVGKNSSYGKIMMSLQTENTSTPLQVKLSKLANWIGGLGSSAAGLLFFVLLFKFLANLSADTRTAPEKASEFLDILIVAITVIVVAVPEGLPLAVTLALAFATTRMLKENNLVRVLRACETMGNATTICSDKTGTLTQNKMTVVAGTLGTSEGFASSHADGTSKATQSITMLRKVSSEVKKLLRLSITLNSTAFEGEENGVPTFIGSKTEVAMLLLAKEHLGLDDLATERSNYKVKQLIPFDSGRKCMGVVIKYNGGYRLLVKGAAELMMRSAAKAMSGIYDNDSEVNDLTAKDKETISATIDDYAQHSLRTIGMLYKDFPQWPPSDAKTLEDDPKMADFEDIFHDMIWIGVVGIHDPLREGVVEAVAQCQRSGVVVRMVTGDNISTARAIAGECGILPKDEEGIVMEGPKFRQLSDAEMDKVLPKLRVLARSSPEDKRILVQRLKHLGETVAVTGDGTNDGPALKMADVGFSMGIAGTEVAKEASSIILLDDNFSSTITALMWGRAVNDAVKKFLQFQITVNITAVVLTFVSAVSNDSNHSVLTAVQLLWVNLIMDTLAALALATDAPTKKILDRPPQPKSEPLITVNMWKMITGQAIYQLVVTLILYFAGMSIFSYEMHQRTELNTIVFNSFVWMQIFNELNNRRLDNKFNVFEGIHRNFWFIGINCIMIAGQIMIIFVGGQAFSITRLNGVQWAISLLTALPCLLWGVLVRCLPDAWFAVVFNGVTRALAVVLRPMWKLLHIIFHPVASVFRAITRFSKRTVQKMTGRKASADEDESNHATSQEQVTEMSSKTVDEEVGMSPMATFKQAEKANLDSNSSVEDRTRSGPLPVPSVSVTGPS